MPTKTTNKNLLGMSLIVSHPDSPAPERQIELYAGLGFDSIFFSSGIGVDFERIPALARHARQCGVALEAVHAPSRGLDAVWTDRERGETVLSELTRILGYCRDGSVDKLVIHTVISENTPVTELGLDFWSRLESAATGLGVHLCYENSCSVAHLDAVLENSHPYHGFCYDAGHENCCTPGADLLGRWGYRLLYTHLHDNFGVSAPDLHYLPFDGRIDWEGMMRRFSAVGYGGTLNLELACLHSEDYRRMTFEAFASAALERLTVLRKFMQAT